MGNLISKVWWFTPNQYTTTFKLSVAFADGDTSEYTFNKTGSSWVQQGTHDGNLVIDPPSDTVKAFSVKAYKAKPFVSFTPTYANDSSSVTEETIQLRRIAFPMTEFTNDNKPYFHFTNTSLPWDIFNFSTIEDIYFTDLTLSVTLPDRHLLDGTWRGWGALNETCSESEMHERAVINGVSVKFMPIFREFSREYANFPVIPQEQFEELITMPYLNNRYVFLPLFESNGTQTWEIDKTDHSV